LDDFEAEDLIADEQMAITITQEGYVKRTPLDTYRRQRRGGRGVAGMKSKEEDFVVQVRVASTVDPILVFTNMGRVHQLKVWELPAGSRTARGKAFVNLLGLQSGEKAAAVVTVKDFMEPDRFVVMATASGQVKRTPLSDFARRRRGGVVAQGMKDGDTLISAAIVGPEEDILLAKSGGRSIRFSVDEIRPMGRSARGVRGVTIRGEEEVVAMVVLSGESALLTVTENGYGKRTNLEDYPVKGRGGLGIIDIKTTERNGQVVTTLPVHLEDEIILITRGGILIRQGVEGISQIGRNTAGVKMVQLDEGDGVVSVALISATENGVTGDETA
jgi:DNA gyrase subunit A